MKYFLFIIPLLLMVPSISYAQKNSANIKECKKCKCVVNLLYNRVAQLDKMPYKKGHEITSMTYVSSTMLTDSSAIQAYLNKIDDKESWIYAPGPQTNKVVLKQRYEIRSDNKKQHQQIVAHFRKEIRSALRIGSKVYTLQLKMEDGRTLTDYVICNPDVNGKSELAYDNIFFGFLNIKIEVVQHRSTTTTIDSVSVKSDSTRRVIKNN